MIFKSDGKQSDLNGFLDNGSHLQGELRFEASFRVDGKLTGTVESEGDLIVGESGEVEGEVRVGPGLRLRHGPRHDPCLHARFRLLRAVKSSPRSTRRRWSSRTAPSSRAAAP